MKHIALLGGSYNPAHDGHRHIADLVREKLAVDELWMLVSFNIFKDPDLYAPLEDRMAMTLTTMGNRSWIRVTDMEKDFCDTMTASSLTMLRAMKPDSRFIWIFGDDNLATFHHWNRERFKVDGAVVPDWQYIMNNFPIAVMERTGYHEAAMVSVAAQYGRSLFIEDPKRLADAGRGWCFVSHPGTVRSSSDIRRQILAGVRGIEGLDPANEKRIYERGLFLPRADFNGAANAPVKNAVRFDTFLLLATTANLVKAVGRHHNAFDSAALLNHAAASWDKSFAKGDLFKQSDVPGELADGLISLYWLASLHGLQLPGGGNENQRSVTQWCDAHYPGRGMQDRLKDCIEELTELCVCEGMEKHRVLNLLRLVLEDSDICDPNAAFDRTYELLQSYAGNVGPGLQSMLDEKMTVNRQRTLAESTARLARKPFPAGGAGHDIRPS